ncbi:zinc finger CCCH domain-containing protein 4-like isoform X2 [Triticum dicoccoides]|uniref:zinc finger CCCH domain-containing protein 4-like isoform X2 n=1 Tax=Triticum dicoccoides TaxID=85692 RepID=UPI00188E7110|nr:zinc finger CCCH domain-containing protein 4-like isoform X2 [Triticum dicoccoides]
MAEGEEEAPRPQPRPTLALEAFRDRIVQAVKENRVTMIVGGTGCGKSSMIPQFLLEENMEPIMCTQPRRFAVVAIAQRVAHSRKSMLGQEVGYHIGHPNMKNLTSTRSKIVFKTAGVMLEQIRQHGIDALQYKVIILDEIHERSVESDLVLAIIKQFMMEKSDFKLVLMSATVDSTRYVEYFKDIGKVELITIPSIPCTNMFQRKVHYLDQIDNMLKMDSESFSTKYCAGEDFKTDAILNPDVYHLIHTLLLHIHQSEPDTERSILVFLPTYHALEQQWARLSGCSTFKVHILHRSIDTDEALETMKASESCRKVILATNMAESSVTIPGVAYVIDSCRSLQVYWDRTRKIDSTKLVWISKSQAEQRKGRTGRTCDGQIFRLVTEPFYNAFPDHESPAISMLSLRDQALMICCADSIAMNDDPTVLLQKILNPPESSVIKDALDTLVQIDAFQPAFPGGYHPRFYGYLLDSLPLSFHASVLTLKFGEMGYLHEGILIGIMLDIQPLPVLQPFGDQALRKKIRDDYFDERTFQKIGKKEATLIANLRAYQFWQRMFKDKFRLEYLTNVSKNQESNACEILKVEQEWCRLHNLVLKALNNISKIYDDIMSTLHRFRPQFLLEINPPKYLQTSEFHHECRDTELPEPDHMTSLPLETDNSHLDSQRCAAIPYISATDFGATDIVNTLMKVTEKMKIELAETCGCRNGDSCPFAHNLGSLSSSSVTSKMNPEDPPWPQADISWRKLVTGGENGHILVVNDRTLKFSSQLHNMVDITPDLHLAERNLVANNLRIVQNVADPSHLTIGDEHELPVPWTRLKRIILVDDYDSGETLNHQVLQKFFENIAIKILSGPLSSVQIILIMSNTKFVKIQVEKLARECFFILGESFLLNVAPLKWSPIMGIRQLDGQVAGRVAYVFNMHPPSGAGIRRGDFATQQSAKSSAES